ncbi:MAG TPA: tetratricopeptide repeat protein [Bryobacteraceae bacterium]|nr:tetratricopeptide repeat protein [Bryobacteraceae bacterium]
MAAAACGRKQSPSVQQLAIVPFDNLSSDPGLNWAGRAMATAIVYDLDPAPEVRAQAVDSVGQAYALPALRVLEGYFTLYQGRLELWAAIEDLSSIKTAASYRFSGPAAEGPLPLLNQLARRLSAASRPFGTSNPEAFRAYGDAVSATDRAAALHSFQSATEADPHFIAAYAGWAESLLATGDRAAGLAVLATAKRQAHDPIDSAELDYDISGATGDRSARAAALANLTRLTPASSKVFKELASLQVSQRKFTDAVRSYEAAAKIIPDDPAIWNDLGYAYAFAQDLQAARRAIERYQQVSPDDANALDSLGEVNFYLGDFAAAEKAFLDADRKGSPGAGGAEIAKAAQARLMTGDLAGADALFAKYIGLAQPSERAVAGYQQAQWEFLSGRRKAAMARIEQVLASLQGDRQILAMCQLSLWKLQTGSAKEAADLADRTAASAQSPQSTTLSAAFRIIAAMQPSNSGSATANAYALLFARRYQEALPLLEAAYRDTNPSADGQIRTLLAWDYVELERLDDARKLLTLYPIPLASGDPLFASVVFPRVLYLRSVVLEKESHQSDAKQIHDLYLKYAGDLPDVFAKEK